MSPGGTGIESEEVPPGEAGSTVSAQALPLCGEGDAGEGPSSLTQENAVCTQSEDEEEGLSEEPSGKAEQESEGGAAAWEAPPARPCSAWF